MAPRPGLAVPAGATDTHIHIYRDDRPAVPGGPPIPGHFPVEKYREMQRRLGLSRVIVVQPSVYGFDNTCTHTPQPRGKRRDEHQNSFAHRKRRAVVPCARHVPSFASKPTALPA